MHVRDSECGVNPSCSEMTLSAKCSGILDPSDAPIDGATGWRLQMVERMTIDDEDNGDMTLLDFPMVFGFPAARGGKLALKVSTDTLGVTGQVEIPACASAALVYDEDQTMNRDVIVVSILDPDDKVFATGGTAGGAANAGPCDIDLPQKTKAIKGSLVRVFEGCPTPSFTAPNSSTGDGVPACSPPLANSLNRFDEKSGGCKVSIEQKPGECPEPCAPMTIQLDCKGVLLLNGTSTDESGWTLRIIARATTNDPSAGDVTVMDLPVDIALPAFKAGKVKLRSIAHELEAAIPPPNTLALLSCTSVEIVDVRLRDASGNQFARLGTASFPK